MEGRAEREQPAVELEELLWASQWPREEGGAPGHRDQVEEVGYEREACREPGWVGLWG